MKKLSRMHRVRALSIVLAAVVLLGGGLAHADTYTWNVPDPYNGDWDTTSDNWDDGGGATTWVNGENTAQFDSQDSNFDLTLTEDITLNRIETLNVAQKTHIYLKSATPQALKFRGEDPSIYIDGSGSKAYIHIQDGVTLDAGELTYDNDTPQGQLTVGTDCSATLTGPVTILRGPFILTSGDADATGVQTWNVRNGGTLFLNNSTDGDVLGDTCEVHLYTQGTLNGDNSEGVGEVTVHMYGYVQGSMTLAALNRIDESIVGLQSDGTVSVASNPYGNDVLGWLITSDSQFGYIDAGGTLRVAASTDDGDLANWTDPDTNYRLVGQATGSATIPAGTIKTIGLGDNGRDEAQTITLGGPLTLAAGGLTMASTQVNNDRTITGGSLTSGNGALYITVFAMKTQSSLVFESPIVGTTDVIYGGDGGIYIEGSATNTYDGTTYVSAGSANQYVYFRRSDGAVTVPGDLVIGEDSYVSSYGDQVNDAASVTVNGTYNTGGETIRSLSGSGTVNQNLTVDGGMIAPGNSVGTLRKNGATLTAHAGTSFEFELGTPDNSDQLVFNNAAELDLDVGGHDLTIVDTGMQEGAYELMLFYDGDGLLSDDNRPAEGLLNLNMPAGNMSGALDYSQTGKIILNATSPKGTVIMVR